MCMVHTPFKWVHFISDHVENFFEGTLKIERVVAILISEKNSSNFFQKKIKLKMAIAQSILRY